MGPLRSHLSFVHLSQGGKAQGERDSRGAYVQQTSNELSDIGQRYAAGVAKALI
jgi:hypothetical protein